MLDLHNYVHHMSPFAIQFTENFGIRWYGLAYLAGFILGHYFISIMVKRGTVDLKPEQVADLITWAAVGTLVGGRLGYCLFYAPHLFTDFDSSFPYWGVLKVMEGGMASHGGILGILVGGALYARKHKKDPFHLLDLLVFGGLLGVMFGRIANFINGELFGRESMVPWAMKFPLELHMWLQTSVDKLSKLGETVAGLSGRAISVEQWQDWLNKYSFDANARYQIQVWVDRVVTAAQKGQADVLANLNLVLQPRHPSQLYEAFLEGFFIFVVLALIWRKPQRPGVISGYFGIIYSVVRILGEQYRMPDAHIGFQLFGLTRGQWLSFGFLAFAAIYLFWALKRPSKPVGGWTRVDSNLKK